MFIGHLPATYLVARRLAQPQSVRFALIVGGLVPDLDLFWFYFIDDRAHLHHSYPTHWPLFWLALLGALEGAFLLIEDKRWRGPLRALLGGVLLHLLLDTIAGGVLWIAPFDSRSFVLATVPAGHGWWVWNFLLHWTFLLEIVVTLWALRLVYRDCRASM